MAEPIQQESRIVRFSGDASYDLAGMDIATAQHWGEAQAERYVAFLRDILASLAQEPTLGQPLEGWPKYRVYTAKYRKRRSARGHKIFYHEIEGGIRVIRILHTAMNWPEHLGQESD